ncbi:MAG: phosphate-responsive 1 family protein [Gemmatimonadetes bacterium]|nr:phosphate-responsive 1 family protein [Gemmatimonadota bacterium]
MVRIPALAAVPAVILALAACSEAKSVTNPAAAPARPATADARHLGMAPVRGAPRLAPSADVRRTVAGAAVGGITYHAGPVILTPKVASVYWSAARIYNGGPTPGTTGAGTADGSLIGYFLTHIGGTPYFNILTTYTNGSGQHPANSLAYTQFWANNTYGVPSGTTSVSDASMLAMLQYAFNTGKLTYDANTLYQIFTSGSVNLGGGFGTQYCAYHSDGFVTVGGVSKHVLYAAQPYAYAKASACTPGYASPNADPAADAEVNQVIGQINRAVTDPYGTGWYDSSGLENMDRCAWTFGATFPSGSGVANVTVGTKSFLIQQNWVNVSPGYCALRY